MSAEGNLCSCGREVNFPGVSASSMKCSECGGDYCPHTLVHDPRGTSNPVCTKCWKKAYDEINGKKGDTMFDFSGVNVQKTTDDADGGMTLTATVKKAEKTPLSEALRDEIVRILTAGSEMDDGALTPQVLARVERVARTGMDLLVAVSASNNNLAALIKRKRKFPFGAPNAYGPDMDGDVDGLDGGLGGSVFAPAPPAENFGMVALREMMATLKNVNQDPVKLVHALAVARREGLTDVVKDLEEKLGVSKPGNEGTTASAVVNGDAAGGIAEAVQRLATPGRTDKGSYNPNDRAPGEDE